MSSEEPSSPKSVIRDLTTWISSHSSLVCSAFIAAIAAIALIPQILAAGFHMDDWIGAGQFMYHKGTGFWAAVTANQVYPARAPMAVVSAAYSEIIGTSSPRTLLLVTALAALVEMELLFLV